MKYSGLQIEDKEFAISENQLDGKLLEQVQQQIAKWHGDALPPFMTLPEDKTVLKTVRKWRKTICQQAERLMVFGIGGSSLGADMLVNGLKTRSGLDVEFFDNVAPGTMARLRHVDWRKSFLLVVSKSGGTAETLSQFLATLPDLQDQLGRDIGNQVAVITENRAGDLAIIAQKLKIPIIDHPAVGGRFSALSVVGLLPAAVAGANVEKILAGSATMLKQCLQSDFASNPALKGAAAQYLLAKAGKNICVTMSYGQKLDRVAAWQGQLVGESLGKSDNSGNRYGITPVAARGVTDQHSQLQLYIDGPTDKQFTLLYDPLTAGQGRKVGSLFGDLPAVAPLVGRSTGELFAAEFKGTRDSLIDNKLPVRTFNIASGDASAFGEMIILLESETVIMAEFFGIDAYDQPAVEDSKIRALAYLAQSRT